MRLSTVFELLVIALLIAFAASRVIETPDTSRTLRTRNHRFSARKGSQEAVVTTAAPALEETQDLDMTPVATGPAKICTCSSLTCNCCRDFSLPVVPIKGPGCATVSYLHDNAMMITMSFGSRVLRNITVNSKKPKPICMGMPGGVSKFCGRLYSIKREGEHFKACLGLELRALDDVEAAVRVSCFRFGPGGVNVEPGEALPAQKIKEEEDEDDDDYGLGVLGDDDEDDDDDFGLTGGGEDDDDDEEEDNNVKPPQKKDASYNDVDSSDSDSDYTEFTSLSDDIFGGFFGGSSKRNPVSSIIDDDDDDDDDYDDDDDDDDDDDPEPPKSQIQPHAQIVPQSQPQIVPQNPQVNLVVMHPVILPSQLGVSSKPAVRRKPGKKPASTRPSLSETSKTPIKATTKSAPLKTTQTTTPSPVRTLGTSTTTPVVPVAESTTAKAPAKKKKKPSRRRRPTTARPKVESNVSPTAITTSSMTVNVVQGGVILNQTFPQKVENVKTENQFKVPMSQLVLETKPIDSQKPQILQTTVAPEPSTGDSEIHEFTTQPIMQNTIPVDDVIDEKQRPVSQFLTTTRPADKKHDEVVIGDLPVDITTKNTEIYGEETTNQDTTVPTSYTNGYFVNNMWHSTIMMENETTERLTEYKHEMDEEDESSGKYDETTVIDQVSSTTEPFSSADEGTDRTEIVVSPKEENNKESSHETEDDEEDDDIDLGVDLGLEDDDEEETKQKNPAKNPNPIDKNDDDDDDLDIGADVLGLEDDDEEENKNKKPVISVKKPADKNDDDDDMFGSILDDDDDESNDDEDEKKPQEEDRAFKTNFPYTINPLLYRLARVSSGSIATARHLPRFSEGRNRRNNKRMRFPSLDVTA